MKHYTTPLFGETRHFTDHTEVELTGHPRCGASLLVEVEFTAERDVEPSDDDPGSSGLREIVSVRPFERVIGPNGFISTERRYLPCPDWLADYLKDCIDVQELQVDWED